ncbi:Copper resistance protein C [Escherichia coli]|nr:Copper resistance protein C [Escherichia coli]
MSILNKAILTGGLVMGVAFSAMAHPELKVCAQADSAVAAPEKIQLNFSENLTVKFSGKINDDGYERHVIILRCRSRQKWRG